MAKYHFLLILILLLGISATSLAQEQIQIGDTVEGEDDRDPVRYELFLEEGQSIEVTLSSNDFDTYLYILDEDGDEITHNDDSDGTDSYLVYTAEDSETIFIQVASCCSGAGPDGDYELSVEEVIVVEEIDGGPLQYGDSVEIEPSGTTLISFTFEGTEGDVVTITAVSQGNDDTNLTLIDPENDEIAFNEDDGGIDRNPAIRRFELPATGQYIIEIEGFSDTTIFSNIDVTLEESELLLVNAGPQTLELSPDHITDIMTFDVEEDVSYLVTVSMSEASSSTLYIYVIEEDEAYALSNVSVTNSPTLAFVYVAEDTGRAHIKLELYSYDDEIDITIQAEVLSQPE